MRLIITRHGETEGNVNGILSGQTIKDNLSALGIEQANKVALRLKNEKIDVIYSSDLERAAETAKIIAKYHPKAKIFFVKDLRERYCGKFEGKKMPDGWHKNFPKYEKTFQDIETNKEIYRRAEKFIKTILEKHKNNTVLLVGHNSINRALICILMHKPMNEINTMERLKNTSINIFDIGKNCRMALFNCTKHLD